MTSKTPKIRRADPESISAWIEKIGKKYPHLKKDPTESVADSTYLIRLMSETDFAPNPKTLANVGKSGASPGLIMIVAKHLSVEMLADLERHLDVLNVSDAPTVKEPTQEPFEIPDLIKVDEDEIEINRAALEGSW